MRVPHLGEYKDTLTAFLPEWDDKVRGAVPEGGYARGLGEVSGRHRRLPRVGTGRLSALKKIGSGF